MFSKVVSSVRVKRRRTSLDQPQVQEPQQEQLPRQDLPPVLCRWSTFNDPFPPVSLGGYRRYYIAHGTPESAPMQLPSLSHTPESSPSPEIPEQSLLFAAYSPPSTPSPILRRKMTIIPEASMESMRSRRQRVDSVSTHGSLRRRRRQVLRTPSIERDFAVYARRIFSPSEPSSIEFTISSPSSIDSAISHESQSSDSHASDTQSTKSDSSHSSVDTPLTSDVEEDSLSQPKVAIPEAPANHRERPESRTSFRTANSGFSDI
ncbi:hypothetical protein BDQ12DRAFT_78651 [Crucibulum laeve]|uniref:Uncharacterized protein n=1 Tax=Crucibulum laeve TaxID=68775 RepID=A0A5C3LSW1_9AGAR|nr:hypothetical protein BDQ12DRAFT_78651 [Crucibulum laeve]